MFNSLLPFVCSTAPGGCACGTLEGGWPRHAGLLQTGPVARVHGVGALYVRVMMAVSVGVAAVFDPDRSPRLSPEVLRRFQGRLSFPRHRQREGQALLRARWHFHDSANQKDFQLFRSAECVWNAILSDGILLLLLLSEKNQTRFGP